ncbi:Ubiquitin-like_domain superfamily [Hexamita inflata]|uniref:Ubiquitin-like domain superfamily n=1 Tax=Hexamita inflata TaxID=28002 RepID=A0AA86PGL1_9EUKA|nr:Ubiquitin-like domain superfamily [Hexamita inflata]
MTQNTRPTNQRAYDPTFSGNIIKIKINTIDLDTKDGFTAYKLRQMIVFTFHLICKPNSFDVYFEDQLLSDTLLTLADYGISNGSSLTLKYKK